MNEKKLEKLENDCFEKAQVLIQKGYPVGDVDVLELTELLIKLELEKLEKNEATDKLIDYNDEIVSIESVGEKETIDISVSGDNLFYCNNILTKNSFGVPATADMMFAIVATEELDKMNQIMVKQLKNRFNDLTKNKRFLIGIDRSKMKLYDLEESAQGLVDDSPSSSPVVASINKKDFSNFKM